jgi:serine/threonine protein kinase
MANAGQFYQGQYLGRQFGNYRLVKLLGEGGFAEVYLGEQVYLDTQVAVKVLTAQLTSDEIERFHAEAQTSMKLHHPHIVQTLDFGMENGLPFLVMRYASNGSLRQRHPEGTRIPLSTVVSYVRQIAAALQYIHDQKLIYRDLKPENMLIGDNNEIWLSDFGIMAVAHSTHSMVLLDKVGTIFYMAPEQIQGKPRLASDQYALGIVVYEWLSGVLPFDGTVLEVVAQHLSCSPPPLHGRVPTISPDVEQVILQALAKDPHQRFESVRKFAEALEQSSSEDVPTVQQPQAYSIHFLKWLHKPLHPAIPLYTYQGHVAPVSALAWSPDGTRIVSAGVDKTVQVWDVISGKCISVYYDHVAPVSAVTWSPDSSYIASGSLDKMVRVWNVASGKDCYVYYGHLAPVSAVTWSPDGTHIASGSWDKTVQVWRASNGEHIYTYREHSELVSAVAWSPHGTSIASGSWDHTIQVWYATSGVQHCTYRGHSEPVYAVAYSPELLSSFTGHSTHVASGGHDTSVQIWDVDTVSHYFNYSGHATSITTLAWSPDSTRVASGSADGTIQVWDAETGKHHYTYDGHSLQVSALAWSPDSTRIASSSWDKAVRVWEAG